MVRVALASLSGPEGDESFLAPRAGAALVSQSVRIDLLEMAGDQMTQRFAWAVVD